MIFVGSLTPPAPITPLGMNLLGVFVGVLYGWTTAGLLWTSLMAICALGFTGFYEKLAQFWVVSFGAETIVFILFMFIFTAFIEEVGLVDYFANLLISFKVLDNRPWLFSGVFILACFFCATFINPLASILVFWNILYIIAGRFGFQRRDKWVTLMVMGVIIASLWGSMVMVYHAVPLIALKTYQAVTGQAIDAFKYICFALPVATIMPIVYVLLCRFIFKPDLKELKHINTSFVNRDALKLKKKQKIALTFLIVFIFLILAPSILPTDWFLTQAIEALGFAGCTIALLVALCIIKIDGKPMMDFKQAASRGINWDILITFAFIIPFANILVSDQTGMKEWVLLKLEPILTGLSPIGFVLVICALATILTNFANNVVIVAVFTTLVLSFGSNLGVPSIPMVVILTVVATIAIAAPIASPPAAMMFANGEWAKTTDLYKYGVISTVVMFGVAITVGWLWANIIF